MSTQYKLVKDLPGFKAGTELKPSPSGRGYRISGQPYAAEYDFDRNFVENNPEWFQRVEEPIIMSCGDKKWGLREVMHPLVHITVTGGYEEYLPPWHNGQVVREYWRDGKLYQEIEYGAIRMSGKFYAFEPITT